MEQSIAVPATVRCPSCTYISPATQARCLSCGTQLPVAYSDQHSTLPYGTLADSTSTATNLPHKSSRAPKGLWAVLAAGGYAVLKLKFVFLLLFKAKIVLLFASMFISIWVYANAWGIGLPAAVGLVALILIHEIGHWAAFRYKKIAVGLPVFIPFVGAFVASKEPVGSEMDLGEIALAGPVVGTAASFVCLGLGNVLGGPLWPYLGLLGLYLNLFNLIPLGFLDGGRIAKAVSLWLWGPGLIILVYLYLQHHNPLLLLISALGMWQIVSHIRHRGASRSREDQGTIQDRMLLGACYFALVALITLTMLHNSAFGWGTM